MMMMIIPHPSPTYNEAFVSRRCLPHSVKNLAISSTRAAVCALVDHDRKDVSRENFYVITPPLKEN